jgi:hypothetical protein
MIFNLEFENWMLRSLRPLTRASVPAAVNVSSPAPVQIRSGFGFYFRLFTFAFLRVLYFPHSR